MPLLSAESRMVLMRPPAPMTPTRRMSFAPRTLVEARAVSPLAMRKLRRFGLKDMVLPVNLFPMILTVKYTVRHGASRTDTLRELASAGGCLDLMSSEG